MAERNVSLIEDSVTGLKTSNGIKLSSFTGGTSTDNAIVRFDGTTGNVQNSDVIIDDAGNLALPANKVVSIGGTSNCYFYADTAGAVEVTAGNSVIIGTNGAQRVKVDSAGNVGIGASSSNYAGYKTLTIQGVDSSHGGVIELKNSDGSSVLNLFNTATSSYLQTVTNSPLILGTNNTERMRIDSAGVLTVQSNPSNGKINIGASNNYIYGDTSNNLILGTAGSDKITIKSSGNVLVGTTTDNGVDKLQVNGSITIKPLASATPANNGELTFEATSNTSVKIKLKGSDGVVRSATLTLS